jgi:hypothetical protein
MNELSDFRSFRRTRGSHNFGSLLRFGTKQPMR